MHTTDKRIADLASAFKEACVDALVESGLTQQDLADACGTNQATISRWFAYSTEFHMPAYIVHVLPEPLRIVILRHLADSMNCSVNPRPEAKSLKGNPSDEALLIMQELGKLVKHTRESRDKRGAIRCLNKIEELTSRARAEVELMK